MRRRRLAALFPTRASSPFLSWSCVADAFPAIVSAMPQPVTMIRVFWSAPGDVADESLAFFETITEWNDAHSAAQSAMLKPVAWKTDTFPSVGRPQAVINEQALTKRYNEYREADPSYGRATRFSYGFINKRVEQVFGNPINLNPVESFGAICEFLKDYIDKTIQGKVNRSRGTPNYKSLEGFLAEQESLGQHKSKRRKSSSE